MHFNATAHPSLIALLLLAKAHGQQRPSELRDDASRRGRRESKKRMSATEDQETPSWRDFMASLKFLEAEGYIEIFYNDKGERMVRIAPGAEKARL